MSRRLILPRRRSRDPVLILLRQAAHLLLEFGDAKWVFLGRGPRNMSYDSSILCHLGMASRGTGQNTRRDARHDFAGAYALRGTDEGQSKKYEVQRRASHHLP